MSVADMVIVGIIGFSAVLGLMKGFLHEFISLLALVLGLVAAFYFADVPLQWIPDESVAMMGIDLRLRDLGLIASFIVIVLVVMMIGKVLHVGISNLVSQGGVKLLDQIVGLAFGFVRGGLIVVLLVIAAGLTPLPGSDTWRTSALLPSFVDWAHAVTDRLPHEYGRHFMFDAVPSGNAEGG